MNTEEEETGSSSECFVFNYKKPEKTIDKASPIASAATFSSDSVFTSERTCSEEKASSSEFITQRRIRKQISRLAGAAQGDRR